MGKDSSRCLLLYYFCLVMANLYKFLTPTLTPISPSCPLIASPGDILSQVVILLLYYILPCNHHVSGKVFPYQLQDETSVVLRLWDIEGADKIKFFTIWLDKRYISTLFFKT